MPYKINAKGRKAFEKSDLDNFTEMQQQALAYLYIVHRDRFVYASEVAERYGYPNGQYFRGVLASLHKKGLLVKGD